ncbi:MAG: glycerophosphodiester phosphodiesterase [Thalassobaculales bacterium]
MPLSFPGLVGHRGAALRAPENTLAAFRAAAAEGAGAVELDAKLTADGVVICFHDDRLERTTDGHGPVATASWPAIAGLDAGAWKAPAFAGTRVPTLAAALAEIAALGLAVNVEIKPCPGREAATAAATIAVIRSHWLAGRPIIVSSFAEECLAVARDGAPGLPRGYLAERLPPDWMERAAALGCAAIHPGHRGLDAGLCRAVTAAGFLLAAWTVNDPARARELVAWGVDAVITDDPAGLASALRR